MDSKEGGYGEGEVGWCERWEGELMGLVVVD